MTDRSKYPPVKAPAPANPNPPKRRQLTYMDYDRYGPWVSAILLVLAIWLVGSCVSATSGTTPASSRCDNQNVPVYGECAP